MSGQDVMKWTSLSFRLVLGLCTAEADMRAQIEASHVPARGAAHGDGNASLHGAIRVRVRVRVRARVRHEALRTGMAMRASD